MNAKRLLLFLAFFVVIGIVITARSGGPAAVLGTGYTNAPGEINCSSCHGGGSYGTVLPAIEIFQQGTSTPVTAYSPGTTYDMRVTVTHSAGSPSRFGFQMTALRLAGNQALANYSNLAANVHQTTIGNGRTYVEHSSPQLGNQFTFRWTAPASGTGNVRFYASGNCVNNDGGTSGDAAASAFLTITELLPLSTTGTQVNVSCFGGSNGSINLVPAGGTTPYTFLWNDGNTNEDRSNLAAGTYSVTVTDAASGTATASFTITQPPVLGLTASVGTILCYGGTATVTLAGTGGTPPYTGVGTSSLTAGTYTRTVTDSKGCTHDTTFTLTQPDSLDVDATVNGQVPCDGSGTTVTVAASGGTGTLTGTGTFTVLTAGNHTYTVTDANNCSKSITVSVAAVSGLTVGTDLTMPGCGADSCAGMLVTDVQTASQPFTESLVSLPGGQAVPDFTALCPGTYAYTVTDNAGCTYEDTLEIAEPTPPTVTVLNITPSTDAGDGAVDIGVTGGVPPYAYVWSPGGETTQDLAFVLFGTYSVTVADANGCETELTGIVVPVNPAGIDETEPEAVFAYPNPFSDAFQLSAATNVLAVRDFFGRKVPYRQTGQTVRLENTVAGIYFIHIEQNGKTAVLKLVAE